MTTPRRRSTIALPCAVTLLLLLGACAGAPSTQAPEGPLSGSLPPGASATGGIPVQTEPAELGPLPAPTLDSVDEIVAAIDDPAQAEQVVVSMLALLGIGLYQADGSPIRKGTESSDEDFFVFEPVAEGLVQMLRERSDPESQLSFADFHAGLVAAGYIVSLDELAHGYADAYAAQPQAAISRLIDALGPVTADSTLSQFEIWLLVLDGFIPPNGATTATACAAAWERWAPRSRWARRSSGRRAWRRRATRASPRCRRPSSPGSASR